MYNKGSPETVEKKSASRRVEPEILKVKGGNVGKVIIS